MTTVYVIWENVRHEGEYMVGIYSTYERAAERVELLDAELEKASKSTRDRISYRIDIEKVKD